MVSQLGLLVGSVESTEWIRPNHLSEFPEPFVIEWCNYKTMGSLKEFGGCVDLTTCLSNLRGSFHSKLHYYYRKIPDL